MTGILGKAVDDVVASYSVKTVLMSIHEEVVIIATLFASELYKVSFELCR